MRFLAVCLMRWYFTTVLAFYIKNIFFCVQCSQFYSESAEGRKTNWAKLNDQCLFFLVHILFKKNDSNVRQLKLSGFLPDSRSQTRLSTPFLSLPCRPSVLNLSAYPCSFILSPQKGFWTTSYSLESFRCFELPIIESYIELEGHECVRHPALTWNWGTEREEDF